MLPLQLVILRLWVALRNGLLVLADRVRAAMDGPRLQGQRGEMTAGVILLALLAMAAIGIAAAIVAKLNSNTAKIPG